MRRAQVLVGLGTIGALAAAGLAIAPVSARPAPDDARVATSRLVADAAGALATSPGFVGVPADVAVDNPAVTRSTRVGIAARAHLSRYGASLGVDPDSLVATGVTHTVAGTDSVRFAQEVDGVPVIGGEVVVGLRADRELGSAQATVSRLTTAASPLVDEAAAAATARAVTARAAGVPARTLSVGTEGRWLFDPAVLNAPAPLGAHTVWRFDVTGGLGVRRLVLVDVRTGSVVLNLDAIQHLDRVVCDIASVPQPIHRDCESGFARTEGGPASGVADVNEAYEFSGAASELYDQVGGVDVTEALGIPVAGVKKLASTVRFCYDDQCPYNNASWTGTGMLYGAGWAAADDVVGHELTHGIIDQYSALFYAYQSGAINESIADVMGEIIDHRNPSPGDTPDDWRSGEDLAIGAIRDLADPSLFGQPDRMTSPLYTLVTATDDSGGVHTNSGVGNKTAYLISQGGSFNGQTITGIDAGDPTLTKTATLYLLVLQTLSSGSDYANLADVLDQSCQDLIGGPAGITTANCAAVHKAGLATELRVPPTDFPADAPATCPSGVKRVLFDSETGDPAAKFVAGPTWARSGLIAASDGESWDSYDPAAIGASALTMAGAVALPPDQPSFLWFQHWWRLDTDFAGFYDGGVVAIDGDNADSLPWVNGPEAVIATGWGNPAAGSVAFGGDSLGYLASRVDLSSYAGLSVTPSFTLYTDLSVNVFGWFLDDIRVYTCDPLLNVKPPTIGGQPKVGKKLTAKPGSWTPAGVAFSYAWLRNGKVISGKKAQTYKLVKGDKGKKVSVRVTAAIEGTAPVTATSKPVGPIK